MRTSPIRPIETLLATRLSGAASEDSLREFAGEVADACDDAGILRHSRRLRLLNSAQRLGIRRFDANLIIAAVQHQSGPRRPASHRPAGRLRIGHRPVSDNLASHLSAGHRPASHRPATSSFRLSSPGRFPAWLNTATLFGLVELAMLAYGCWVLFA